MCDFNSCLIVCFDSIGVVISFVESVFFGVFNLVFGILMFNNWYI